MEIFEELIERWKEEFGRAVQMFTGEKPVLISSPTTGDLSTRDIEEQTWWKQVVENLAPFSIWAGGDEHLWNALVQGPGAQSTFFKMVSSANQAIATALSAGSSAQLHCREGLLEMPVLPLQVEWSRIKVRFRDNDAGVIHLLIEKTAFSLLNVDERTSSGIVRRGSAARIGQDSPMLERLLDLKLPVSILLGRASLTIKEALKLMPGSVVELDRQVGDYVEIIVHGTVVAKGEIVSVKGNYGVRIKEVISRQDRIALHEAA